MKVELCTQISKYDKAIFSIIKEQEISKQQKNRETHKLLAIGEGRRNSERYALPVEETGRRYGMEINVKQINKEYNILYYINIEIIIFKIPLCMQWINIK